MTRQGEKPTELAKKRARHSNPFSCAVKTPDGMFRSINECAQHYNRTPHSIVHRCKMGEFQRRNNKTETLHHNDWRGWELWGIRAPIAKRRVVTPLGEFDSIRAASKAHKTAVCTIRDRCIRGIEGYGFIDKE